MKPLVLKVCFLVLLTSFVVFPYKKAQASFIFSIFSSNNQEKVENTENISDTPSIPENSQNMNVLQASISPDREANIGGGDITVESGALASEIGPLGTAADVKTEYLSDTITTYIVRKGDSISDIAKMFDVSSNTILWANDLKKGSTLKEGMVLTILPISGVEYVVKSGDTLNSIAKKFGGDKDEISKYNGITDETLLAVGTEVIIPDGEIIASSRPGSSSVSSVSNNSSSYSGYYTKPLKSYRRTQGIHGRNGVDMAAPVGTKVFASAAGTVIISRNSGWNGGYGEYVVISHPNGTQTLYSHLSGTAVVSGAKVEQGELIGYVGNTGKSTGAHLHFEIRGGPRNPF